MSKDENDDSSSLMAAIMNPSRGVSQWFIALGLWGLFLAVLNIMGEAHPNYHWSWGGLLTFEATNAAFEQSDGFKIVASDFVFMALCGALAGLGFKTMAGEDGGIGAWAKSLLVNDTWPALADPGYKGWSMFGAAWCLLLGFVCYAFYGIRYTGWTDPGVYSVTIALLAFGFALKASANAPAGDENLD
ncbi:MAG TPA: hypothetical protein HA356_07000 [Candidatus Poseidoniaceae archaeon]|nr:hypothetical protein [Candidatus Poseidoniaceae archaeon]|tara:strand:+ start:1860 stop:2423 length:564 start_codon:yes stop_codon:yes gene_type:complete